MDTNFKALEISELLPPRGRPRRRSKEFTRGAHVLVGDQDDIRLCENLYKAEIDHNWYSQHLHIGFTNGEKFWYYSQKINGRKAFLFRSTVKNLGIFERKLYEKKLSSWVTSATSIRDLIAVSDLIFESVCKERPWREAENSKWYRFLEKNYGELAREQILNNLNRLSVPELKGVWECISGPVSSPKKERISIAA